MNLNPRTWWTGYRTRRRRRAWRGLASGFWRLQRLLAAAQREADEPEPDAVRRFLFGQVLAHVTITHHEREVLLSVDLGGTGHHYHVTVTRECWEDAAVDLVRLAAREAAEQYLEDASGVKPWGTPLDRRAAWLAWALRRAMDKRPREVLHGHCTGCGGPLPGIGQVPDPAMLGPAPQVSTRDAWVPCPVCCQREQDRLADDSHGAPLT